MIKFPIDNLCSEIMDETFSKVQKKKKSSILLENHIFLRLLTNTSLFHPCLLAEHTGQNTLAKPSKSNIIFPTKALLNLTSYWKTSTMTYVMGQKFPVTISSLFCWRSLVILPVMFKFLDKVSLASAFTFTSLRWSLVLDKLFWPSKRTHGRSHSYWKWSFQQPVWRLYAERCEMAQNQRQNRIMASLWIFFT